VTLILLLRFDWASVVSGRVVQLTLKKLHFVPTVTLKAMAKRFLITNYLVVKKPIFLSLSVIEVKLA